MEIQTKLMQYQYHFIITVVVSIILALLFQVAPRFLTILAYFWPLFVSTAVLLMVMIVFGQLSPPSTEIHGEKTGEGLLDYVAGRPE
ncbi:unnamed protein product, partial [Vitis vinifera]|uniref:Uncharacterized protein n=1 Tax=Vitis vinifera TaxID=29760 RepID=D7T5G5_VITVI